MATTASVDVTVSDEAMLTLADEDFRRQLDVAIEAAVDTCRRAIIEKRRTTLEGLIGKKVALEPLDARHAAKPKSRIIVP